MHPVTHYRAEVERELIDNILPFYVNYVVDEIHGGFYGYVANDRSVQPGAPKGLIQVTRILWTFAAASRIAGDPVYPAMAARAYDYLLAHFWDRAHGGLVWMVDPPGRPLQRFKMVYGQAFGIYAFSEHFLATGQPASLDRALALYHLLEQHALDPVHGGYWEACEQDWTPSASLTVDTVTQPVRKSMNTHLHMLEAYTALLRAWPDAGLAGRLRDLIRITLDRMVGADGHFALHFDAAWQRLNDRISFGHDIEGSWLLVEAAQVLGDPALLAEAHAACLHMAEAVLAQGVAADGGLFNEADATGVIDASKDWWPQAEAMVGFLNAYELSGDPRFLEQSLASWRFVQDAIVDREYGEWFWGVDEQGRPRPEQKSGPWKGPYHNGRACMEIMRRIG